MDKKFFNKIISFSLALLMIIGIMPMHLAIAALGVVLGWVLKKFFPNVWSTISVWWIKFCDGWRRLFADLMETPFMKD